MKALRARFKSEPVFLDRSHQAAGALRSLEKYNGNTEGSKPVSTGEARYASPDYDDLFGMVHVFVLERFREKWPLIHLLLMQIAVESHSHIANENPAERRDANFVHSEHDEAFVARFC